MALKPFDDHQGFIWYNGQFVEWKDAKIHVLTHGLHYASSVFEGERVYNGKIFKLTEHSERLIHSGELLGFKVPYTASELDEASREVVKRNNILDGYVRPVAWRGAEQMGVSAQQTKIHVAIAAWEWPTYFSEEAKQKGLKIKTSSWRRPAPNTAPTQSKAAGLYMICTMSKHEVENQGYDDALMLDWRGQVAELTGANIFLVIEGKIHTPTPDCFLDGITRRTVIDLAKKRGIEIIERAVWPEDFKRADEVFVTGTAAEVVGIGQIDDQYFQVGSVTKSLAQDYAKMVREQ